MTTLIKNKNMPKLRFPGFVGGWENKLLGDMEVFVSDGNYGEMYPKANEMKNSGVPFIRANNIKDLKIIWDDMKYIDKELHKVLKSGHLEAGDILVTTRGDIGMLAYVSDEFHDSNINAQICLLRTSKSLSPKYLLNYLASKIGQKQFKELQTGSALKQLPKGNLAKVKINAPSLTEQQKIAGFLGSVDELIGVLRAQKENFEKYKKGMMQKIFSQEIRFKDENGNDFPDWEERKLIEIGKISTSSVDKKIYKDQKMVSLLNYMDVYRRDHIFQSDKFQIVSASDSQIISSNLKKGDVLFTPSSETPDDIGHSAVVMEELKDALFSYHLVRFRPQQNILDHNFSAYAFKNFNFYKELWRKAQGATRFTLSKDAFESSKIKIPKSTIEQQKIAEFLTSLDNLIESKQQQISQAEQWKKGLMQGLFV